MPVNGGSAGLITTWYGVAAPHIAPPHRAIPASRDAAARVDAAAPAAKACAARSPHNRPATKAPRGNRVRAASREPPVSRHVKFSAVVDAYEDWLADHAPPEVLRERLARLPTVEG